MASSLSITDSASNEDLPETGGGVGGDLAVPGTAPLLSAGDVDGDSAVLWARVATPGEVRFEIATDPGFAGSVVRTVTVDDPLVPAKLLLGDDVIDAGTRYHWRATDAAGNGDSAEFVSPDAVGTSNGFRLGVSGDWRGELSPYPAIRNADERGLDLFVKLGDTIYADFPSPVVPAEQATTIAEYRLKHLEVYSERAGLNAWNDLQRTTAIQSTIDDHEVVNDFAGGEPVPAGLEDLYGAAAPTLVNDSPLYETGLQTFHEYNAIEERRYGDTGEARTAGELDLYRYTTHGADAATFVLDARSFRDAPLADPNPTDAAQVAAFLVASADPSRTLLGEAQLEQLERDLLDAEAKGVAWKFVMVPEPIQNFGPANASDRFEGYAGERTRLLRFVDDNDIENVVFVAADVHGTAVNNLTYQLTPFTPQIALPSFEITTGSVAFDPPFGPAVIGLAAAVGLVAPALAAQYAIASPAVREQIFQQVVNGSIRPFGYDPLGLADNLDQAEGLLDASLLRGGYTATTTYGWTEFVVDEATDALTVRTWGIAPYDEAEPTDPAVVGRVPAVVSEFTVQASRAIEFSLGSGGESAVALSYENAELPGVRQDSASLTDTTGADLARFRQAGGDVTIFNAALGSGVVLDNGTNALATLSWLAPGEAVLRQDAPRRVAAEQLTVEDFTGTALRLEGWDEVDLALDRPGAPALILEVEGVQRGSVSTDGGDDVIRIRAQRGTGDGDALLTVSAGAGEDVVEIGSGGGAGGRLRDTRARIDGGEGDDVILGAASADTIDGGAGADTLLGGGGRDVFVLRRGEAEGDVLLDFNGRQGGGARDLLLLLDFDIDATLLNSGGDTWTVGGESFRLTGVTALRSGDYLLA